MTYEQAIYLLKGMRGKAIQSESEALNMAIEALSAQQNLVNDSQGFSQGDYVRRQDAIGAVKTYWKKVVDDIPKGVGFEEMTQLCDMALEHNANILKAIDQLPSAQPERTCVNCGRTVNNGGWYADGGTRCPIEEHYALPKDGYCHLWEKRNVTDDDYPERRTDG